MDGKENERTGKRELNNTMVVTVVASLDLCTSWHTESPASKFPKIYHSSKMLRNLKKHRFMLGDSPTSLWSEEEHNKYQYSTSMHLLHATGIVSQEND